MKHRMLTLIALLALCTGAGASLHAQVRFGVQASWGDNSDFQLGNPDKNLNTIAEPDRTIARHLICP